MESNLESKDQLETIWNQKDRLWRQSGTKRSAGSNLESKRLAGKAIWNQKISCGKQSGTKKISCGKQSEIKKISRKGNLESKISLKQSEIKKISWKGNLESKDQLWKAIWKQSKMDEIYLLWNFQDYWSRRSNLQFVGKRYYYQKRK